MFHQSLPDYHVKIGKLHAFINKFLSLYVHLFYSKLPIELRYFVRDNIYLQLRQKLYFFRDHVFKKKYKVISYQGEFGGELLFALPFAYWHYKNGTLLKTVSDTNSKDLYFFSENHQEKFKERIWQASFHWGLPHTHYNLWYNFDKFEPVPYKEHFKNNVYLYDKPILIIANRFNMEWDGPPVSFIDIPTLDYLIKKLKDKYQIIYNRPGKSRIVMDNSEIYELNENEWLRTTYPEVVMMEDLYERDKDNLHSFNHLQLKVYANADKFISVHGGTGTFASYFGGTNIILSKKGLEHTFGCFHTIFPKLSGATILHAKTEEDLKDFVERYY
jgi:hypothetical protein